MPPTSDKAMKKLKDRVSLNGYYVGKRVDGMVFAINKDREIHGIVTKVWETLNFGWVAIRCDDGCLAIFKW